MKTFLSCLILFVILLCAAAYCSAADAVADWRRRRGPLDVAAFLGAIRQVETGDQPDRIGAAGERSAYQFTADTWARHTQRAHWKATSEPGLADHIARLHLAYLRGHLKARGLAVTPEHLALAWHYGPNFSPGDWGRSDYAARVANLYSAELARRAKS